MRNRDGVERSIQADDNPKLRCVFPFIAVMMTLLIIGAVPAQGDTVYASGYDGTRLVRLDTVTGVGTSIGPFGIGATYAAAFSPTGTLYTMVDSYSSTGRLATVDLATGAATVIGAPVGIPDMMVMEFDSSGTLYTASWATNTLYTMNSSTGVATPVGGLGFASIMDFAFNSSGTLYGVNNSAIWTINTATGAGSFVANLSGTDNCQMGLFFDSADNLFATSWCSANSPLYKVNPTTGATTIVGLTGLPYLHGGDVFIASSAVPEPTSYAIVIGVGLLAVFAGRKFRSGKTQQPIA
jgi:hypothetical protein